MSPSRSPTSLSYSLFLPLHNYLWHIYDQQHTMYGIYSRCTVCSTCTGSLYICLHCVYVGCSKHKHINAHCKSLEHHLSLSLDHSEIYCITCQDMVYHLPTDRLKQLPALTRFLVGPHGGPGGVNVNKTLTPTLPELSEPLPEEQIAFPNQDLLSMLSPRTLPFRQGSPRKSVNLSEPQSPYLSNMNHNPTLHNPNNLNNSISFNPNNPNNPMVLPSASITPGASRGGNSGVGISLVANDNGNGGLKPLTQPLNHPTNSSVFTFDSSKFPAKNQNIQNFSTSSTDSKNKANNPNKSILNQQKPSFPVSNLPTTLLTDRANSPSNPIAGYFGQAESTTGIYIYIFSSANPNNNPDNKPE